MNNGFDDKIAGFSSKLFYLTVKVTLFILHAAFLLVFVVYTVDGFKVSALYFISAITILALWAFCSILWLRLIRWAQLDMESQRRRRSQR